MPEPADPNDPYITKSMLREAVKDVATIISDLMVRMDERFAQIDERFAQVDKRFAQMDKRFDKMDARFDKMDKRFDRLELVVKDQSQKHKSFVRNLALAVSAG